jgi:hypothetical protein
MDPSALAETPSFPAFEPLVDAIAEAVVRKIEERRRIDAMADAVLRRVQELRGDEHRPALHTADGNDGSLPSEDELYELILGVLAQPEPEAESNHA